MPSLGTKFTSKHLKSSRDTSPYRFAFKFEGEFANLGVIGPINLNLRAATSNVQWGRWGFLLRKLAAASRRGGSASGSCERKAEAKEGDALL